MCVGTKNAGKNVIARIFPEGLTLTDQQKLGQTNANALTNLQWILQLVFLYFNE
jgi:hypothetical protein